MAEKNVPTSLTDLQLAHMACNDSKAEEFLLRRLYPSIFNIAQTIVGSRWLADEVAQLTAVQVLKSLDSFRGEGSLESWAGRITYRVSAKIIRRERKSKTLLPLSEENASSDEPADRTLSRRLLFDRLLFEMEKIPSKRRVPLQLHLVYGYTVNEVADLTDVSPNTVKDRLRTAYKELRTIMDEQPNLRRAMLEAIS